MVNMRRSTTRPVLLAISLLTLSVTWRVVPAHAQDAGKGASLMKEARTAIGGDEKVAAVRRLQVRGVVRRNAGTRNIEGDLEIAIELPDKFRRDETLTFGPGAPSLERLEVLNGSDSWEKTNGGNGRGAGFFFGGPGGGPGFGGGGGRGDVPPGAAPGRRQAPSPEDLERLRAVQRQNRRADFERLLVAFLLTTTAPVNWVGTAESPDGTADVLEISPAAGPVTRLLLDSASHLPLMLSWVGGPPRGGGGGRRGGGQRGGDAADTTQGAPAAPANPGDPGASAQGAGAPADRLRGGRPGGGFQPATFEMHFSEYKTVNGIRLPHLITRGINGETNEELEISNYRVNPTFKADTFSNPQ